MPKLNDSEILDALQPLEGTGIIQSSHLQSWLMEALCSAGVGKLIPEGQSQNDVFRFNNPPVVKPEPKPLHEIAIEILLTVDYDIGKESEYNIETHGDDEVVDEVVAVLLKYFKK